MAGVGVQLHKIYGKNSITSKMVGFIYSTVLSIAPMLLVIISVLVMGILLDFSKVGYARRELFSCTVLYIFIFSLLAAAPFNSVLSRYISDVIYKEQFDDIMPCFIVGLFFNILLGCLAAIPFCVVEYLVGKVSFAYTFTGFCGFVSLIFVFYAMLYLNIFKDYRKTALFFIIGSVFSVLLSLLLVRVFKMEVTCSMLASLVAGFFLIACFEFGTIKRYFKGNSENYRDTLGYFKKHWKLVASNTLYTLGLFIHNFVFWGTGMQMRVAKVFICAPSYDMATCIAMFTNISATVIFITRVEMYFHERYRAYSEAIIGGRGADIENTKNRMFSQLSAELMNLARIQFILSVIVFFICIIILPQIGFSGLIMKIYPSLASGYFILFTMYSCIVFLFYFNDMDGALMTSLSFCVSVFIFSLLSSRLSAIWFGLGVVGGSIVGWTVAYFRIRWIEKHIDEHIFCEGNILEKGKGPKPSAKVFDRYSSTGEDIYIEPYTPPKPKTAKVAAPEPEDIAESAAVSEPEDIAEYVAASEPEIIAEPVAVPEPEIIAEPTAVPEPEAVAAPGTVYEPEVVNEPNMPLGIEIMEDSVVSAETVDEGNVRLFKPSYLLNRGINIDGRKYIRIMLTSYAGEYVGVYIKSDSEFHEIKLDNNRINDMKPIIKIEYNEQGKFFDFMIRTFDIEEQERIYSEFSDVKTIRI